MDGARGPMESSMDNDRRLSAGWLAIPLGAAAIVALPLWWFYG
jgi:hypothetical protein